MQLINWTNNKALSVSAKSDTEGQAVIVDTNQSKGQRKCTKTKVNNKEIETCKVAPDYQSWRILYLDKADKTETKGLNEEFGFHINRPFYLVS